MNYQESKPVEDYDWLDDLPIRTPGNPNPTFRSWYVVVWESPILAPLSQAFHSIKEAIETNDFRKGRGYKTRVERRTSEVIL